VVRLVQLYLQGKLLLDELINTRLSLADINDGSARSRPAMWLAPS